MQSDSPQRRPRYGSAADAYRGVIPADRWHEPYLPMSELDEEIAAGVESA